MGATTHKNKLVLFRFRFSVYKRLIAIMRATVAMVALFGVCTTVLADSAWPNRPLRIIVPSAPAGGTDIAARLLAERLSVSLGQTVVVENKPGAGGVIGASHVAKAAPDGYTMLIGFLGPIAISPLLHKDLSYDVDRDFVPVTQIGNALNVLVVNSSLPIHSVDELIAYAKENPVAFGSTGIGAADHLAGELFNSMTGLSMTHVPYKGGAPAMLGLLGGQVQIVFSTVSTAVGSIGSGKIRPLGMAGGSRFEIMPDIPTVAEAGVPGFEINNWYGMLVPAGTPEDIVQRLGNELHKALEQKDIQKKLLEAGIVPVWNSPAEFASYIKDETVKWKKVLDDAKVVIEQ